MLSRLGFALGVAALATFAYVVHLVWDARPEPIGVREALAHPHLLGMTHGDRHVLFVSGAAALVCFTAVPLVRRGLAGMRSWRGALLGAAVVGVLLTGGGVYRYDHPPLATQCLPFTVNGESSNVCRHDPDKQQAIRQTEYLLYGAGAVVLLTVLSVPALRVRRRLV